MQLLAKRRGSIVLGWGTCICVWKDHCSGGGGNQSNSWRILLLRKERESLEGKGTVLPGPFWKEPFGSLKRPFSNSVNPIALPPGAVGFSRMGARVGVGGGSCSSTPCWAVPAKSSQTK